MFKYWQKIRVTSSFYEGMEGTVIKEDIPESPFKKNYYICILKFWTETFESQWIPESNLELIK